ASPVLVVDLCGDVELEGTRVWRITYDRASGEAALLALILAGRTPLARIEENGVAIAAGRLGTEYGGIALASFQDMLARTASLIVAAMTGTARSVPDLPEPAQPNPPPMPSAGKLGVR